MSDAMDTVHGSGKMGMQAKGISARNASGLRVYFHADSETFLVVEGNEVEQESNRLNELLGYQVDSQMRIDELTKKCSDLDWGQVTQRNALQNELQKEAQRLDELNKKLKVELNTLTPTEELPKTVLLDSKSKNAIGLMELIEVRGGVKGTRFTYVRSDKIQSHWRRYQLNNKQKESGKKSFIKREEYIDEQGVKKSRDKIDFDELKSQVSKVKPNMLKGEQDIVEQHIGILGKWAEDMNESLRHSPYKGEHIEFDSQSQLMRWTYGAGLTEELDPFEIDFRSKKKKIKNEGQLNGKGSAYASLALAESKSKLTLSLPDTEGITILYPLKPEIGGGMGELGTLRFDFEIALAGSIGASLGVELGVSTKANWAKGVPASAVSGGIPGKRTVDITKVIEEPEVKGELTVFAGAQASINVSGAIMWRNPDEKQKYTPLAKVALGATAQFGAGWSGTFRFSYENGRVRVLVRGGMCWGGGGKGSVAFDVDSTAILTDFMPCLTYMLRNADYIKLSETVIRGGDFYAFCALPLLIGMYGVNQLIDNFQYETTELLMRLEKSWDEKELRVALMQHILNTQGACLKFSPPESKGAAIASLIERNFWDDVASPASHAQTECEGQTTYSARKRAVLLALRWVQSKRDYENVMQHLSKGFDISGSWQGNQQEVVNFLSIGEKVRTYGGGEIIPNASTVKILPSYYAENLMKIYNSLPDFVEVKGNELQPLVEVSPVLMESCTRVIVNGVEI